MCSAATRDRLVRLQYRAPKFDFIIKIIYNKYTILKEKRYAGLAQLERASPLLDKLLLSNIMERNTKEVGNLTELQCITGLYELGCDISIPFGNSQKYDLIIDYQGQLYKVQIKHANEKKTDDEITHFSFKTRWQGHNTNGYTQTSYTKKDIDFFATYHQGKVFLIPIEECSGAEKTIRYSLPKNGQRIGINFAKDYYAEEVLKRL